MTTALVNYPVHVVHGVECHSVPTFKVQDILDGVSLCGACPLNTGDDSEHCDASCGHGHVWVNEHLLAVAKLES